MLNCGGVTVYSVHQLF